MTARSLGTQTEGWLVSFPLSALLVEAKQFEKAP